MLFSIDFFAQTRGSCCPKKCVILIRDEALDRHWNDLLAARRNGREGFWFWVRTIYCVILPEVRRKGQFYIDLPHKNVSTANDDVNLAPNPRAPPPPPPTIDPPAQPAQEEPAPCLAEEETTSSEAPGLMGGIAGSFMCDGHDDLVRHENFGFAAEDGPSTPPQSPSASDHEALTGTTARRQLLTHITPSPKRTRDKWLESALSISSRDKRRRRASPFDKFRF